MLRNAEPIVPDDDARRRRAFAAQRVLLVDDDAMLLRLLTEALESGLEGTSIEPCRSALAAVRRLAAVDYDVVVSDILMPELSGLDLLERVRELRPEALTVLVTGLEDRELTLRALRGGAYDLILKPIEREHLVATVRRAMETRRLRREVERQQAALRQHADVLEHTVAERTRELREAHRAKDEFLATVSHELRTPLTAILGWARLLRRGMLDVATAAQAIEAIERNARSQSQLIDDLLDVSRIITGKLRLEVQRVELLPVLDAALDAILPAAQAKRIALEPDIPADLGAVAGDPERLQQIFWNLLSNALKFTPDGGRVAVRGARLESHVEIEVTDDGSGISPDFLPFVFDRFRQGSAAHSASRRGLGLGLAIVRHLVELHGGTVAASSEGAGKGSTFTIRLPTGGADSAAPARTDRRITLSAPEAPRSRCLRGIRVLVVDDEDDTRTVLRVMLEHEGAHVTAVASAAEALAAFEPSPPQVLLCDIGLEGEDGYSLIGRVRSLPPERGGDVPAVALTAFARADDRLHALAAGFQLHLPKPGPPDLAAIVADLLERREERR